MRPMIKISAPVARRRRTQLELLQAELEVEALRAEVARLERALRAKRTRQVARERRGHDASE